MRTLAELEAVFDEPLPTPDIQMAADNLLRAIDWAMEVDPLLRPQSVAEFRDALTADTEPEPENRSALDWLAGALLGRGGS